MAAPQLGPVDELDYPGCTKPMGETGVHVRLMIMLLAALRHHFRDDPNVYVIGNINLYYERGNRQAVVSPDIMVTRGVPSQPERRSFFTWVENTVPNVIIELASEDTHDEDQTTKRDLYERLGVREYFLFDPDGRWLPERLMGYRLMAVAENGEQHDDPRDIEVRHAYEPKPLRGGRMASMELGLELACQGDDLALFSIRTGQQLLMPQEAYAQVESLLRSNRELQREVNAARLLLDQAESARAVIAQQREQAQQQAEEARQQREQAQQQAEEARMQREQAQQQAEEARQQREQAQQQAEEARQQRELAEQQRDQERQQREALEQELARLRALLPPTDPT